MKNPIKHLKHLWKDPVNNMEEANARKKEIMKWLIGSIIATFLFSGLSLLGPLFYPLTFLSVFGLIAIFGIMFFGFLLFIIKKAKEKFAALTCAKCNTMATIKTPEDYAAFVSYTVGTHEASYIGISHPASNNGIVSEIKAKGSASVVVSIDLKCPHCGNIKPLKYVIVPFKCSAVQEKVPVRDIEAVKMRLESAVKEVVKDYNDPETRPSFPYSIHSKKNPNYENRTKPQLGTSWIPRYNDVRIDFRKDVEEMVDDFFLENQLDGKIVDPNKPKKSK